MSRQQGFTLLEMLLAVSIFALVGLASYEVLQAVTTTDSLSRQRLQRLEALKRTILLFERDIIQLSPRYVRLPDETHSRQFLMARPAWLDSDDDALIWIRGGWRNPQLLLPRGDQQLVAYRVLDGKLQRLYFLFPDVQAGTEPQVQDLLDGVTGLRFRYFVDGRWQDNLADRRQPLGVQMVLTLDDIGEIRRAFLLPEPLHPQRDSNRGESRQAVGKGAVARRGKKA